MVSPSIWMCRARVSTEISLLGLSYYNIVNSVGEYIMQCNIMDCTYWGILNLTKIQYNWERNEGTPLSNVIIAYVWGSLRATLVSPWICLCAEYKLCLCRTSWVPFYLYLSRFLSLKIRFFHPCAAISLHPWIWINIYIYILINQMFTNYYAYEEVTCLWN